MKNLKRKICFIVIVVVLAGTMTPLISVRGSSTFQGTVEDCSNNPLSGVSVVLADCYFNILGYDTTDSSGDYSFDVTLNGNSPYYLTATKTRFTTGMETVYGQGTYNIDLVGITEKIAVFFWASDAGLESVMDSYINYLELYEDYTKFYKFEDSSDVESDFQTVDAYEHDQDIIFVYIMGHGNYYDSHSYTYFKEDSSSRVYSNTCRGYMDQWEAPKKCLLVESCESGDWADDFAASPYLAMSTSDEFHSSHSYNDEPLPYEGEFSHWFFVRLALGVSAVAAFNHASNLCPNQHAKISDYSSYVWFN